MDPAFKEELDRHNAIQAEKSRQYHIKMNPPLHKAAKKNDVAQIKLLLSQGHEVDLKNPDDSTPLHFAAKTNQGNSHYDSIETLLKNGASVDSQDENGKTALQMLVKNANVDTVALLVGHKANVNLKEKDTGETALFDAIRGNKLEVVQLLLDHGSDVNCASGENQVESLALTSESTPLHVACRYDFKIVKLLLKSGARVDALDREGRTPLAWMFLYSFRSFEVLALMLKYNDVNGVKRIGEKSFFLVETPRIWKILLEHIAKLQVLGLKVNSGFYDTICQWDKYSEYFESCVRELELAKSSKFDNSWVSFFNLLVDGRRKLKNYAGNEDLVRDFEDSDCLKKFPIYGARMRKNMEKGIRRRELFDKSAVLLSGCTPILNPTHLIIRDVLDFVSTKDLVKFCE